MTTAASPLGPNEQAVSISVENPSTGAAVGSVRVMGTAAVTALVSQARAAQPAWEELGFAGRGRFLRRMQKRLVGSLDDLVQSIHAENGKSFEEATLEVMYGAMSCAFWAKKAESYLTDERITSRSPFQVGRKMLIAYQPVGVVGVIGPWNNPLLNNFGDVIPALAAGNTAILKPSEVTPLTSLLVEELTREIGLPQGVFAVATGAGETGSAVVDSVDAVMFTGSTRTGRKVAARCGERLIPCSLELGGKDPVIVLADADLDRAAGVTLFSSMHNSGQTCTSTERVYVEAPVYDRFVELMTERVTSLRVGESTGFGSSDVGSLTFPPQLDIVQAHVQDALAKGARALTGGDVKPGPGRAFLPTVLVDVDHSMSCMREETFGPTLPIMRVADADEAVRLANDSDYGLQAVVYTRDLAKARTIARQLRAGVVNVNDALSNYFALDLPMGGWKDSGLGARHGAEGIRKFTKRKSVVTQKSGPGKELTGMPFDGRTFWLLRRLIKAMYGHPRNL